jgi:hypothetical protein
LTAYSGPEAAAQGWTSKNQALKLDVENWASKTGLHRLDFKDGFPRMDFLGVVGATAG